MIIGISGYIGSGKNTVAMLIQALTTTSSDGSGKGRYAEDPLLYLKNYEGRPNLKGGWEIKAFAGRLKQICSLLTGIPVHLFEQQDVKDSFLGHEWDQPVRAVSKGWAGHLTASQYLEDAKSGNTSFIMQRMKVRELLQKMGTDAMRDKVHPNIHINALFADYKPTFHASVDPYKTEVHKEDIHVNSTYPNWIISDLRFPNEARAIKDRGGFCIRINRPGEYYDKLGIRHESETALDNYQFDAVIENNDSLEILLKNVKATLYTLNLLKC